MERNNRAVITEESTKLGQGIFVKLKPGPGMRGCQYRGRVKLSEIADVHQDFRSVARYQGNKGIDIKLARD